MKSIFSKHTVESTPHYKPCAFLNSEEVAVYKALSKVFDANTKVLTKVCLAELVDTPKERQYLAHWRRVQRRTVSFLICAASNLKPILAIKLETALDSKKRRASGPDILEEVLEDIGLPLLRLRAQDEYEAEDLVKKINFTLKENRQTKPAVRHDADDPGAMTTSTNRRMIIATRSVSNLWSTAKDKYRMYTLT